MVARGVGPASLEELMGEVVVAEVAEVAEPAMAVVEPAQAPAPAPAPTPAPAAIELPLVDVRSLVYRGHRALARAQELREIAKHSTPEALPALFDEVCDLVVLALEPGA
jgi:hypothetical protein